MTRFENKDSMRIDTGAPNSIESTIRVSGLQTIKDVTISLDIKHTYTADLNIALISPNGVGVVLVAARGRNGNDFNDTHFDDQASTAIADALPPFQGTYRPEGQLSTLKGVQANGIWTLSIVDDAYRDGGFLKGWSLSITDEKPRYALTIDFVGGLSASQMAVFSNAAQRWSEVITSDLSLTIQAKGTYIDGAGRTLGQAGPMTVKPETLFPNTGIMEFDTADLARMEINGSLYNVILHEMAHVIGVGTLWQHHGLLEKAGTDNPLFTGAKAMHEYGVLLGQPPTKIPVANTGGAGTADGHWRELTFGNELLSGYLNTGVLPLSRLTIAMLEDMGYEVNYDAADPYVLPSLRVAMAALAENTRNGVPYVNRPICEGI